MAAFDNKPTPGTPLESALPAAAGDFVPVGPGGASAENPLAPRRWQVLVGLGTALPGAALTAMGLGVGATPKLSVTLIGLVLLYIGISTLGRRLRGRSFDLSYYLAALWLGVIFVSAAVAGWIPFQEYTDISKTLTTPILERPDPFSTHPLGTDNQGLDMLGGVVHGAQVSLTVAIGATLIGMFVGGSIGMAAGYFRGKVDAGVGLFVDSALAFPPLILLLALATVLTPNVRNMTLVLAVLSIPMFVRISRANTMAFAQREFVLASRVLGVRSRWILIKDIFPNVVLPLISYAFIVVGALIVAEAALSFLGLGIPRPQPTWGNMIAAGQDEIKENPHLVLIPSAALFLTVFSLNRVGEKVQRIWDPRGSRL